MAEFAMRFGPSELFWTAIFGITVITGLSSGAMLKGLFGGALGMLLSTVGYSTLTGEPVSSSMKRLTAALPSCPRSSACLPSPRSSI